jgi:hypothetical protein
MDAEIVAKPTLKFLSEWLTSTVQVLFSPTRIDDSSDDDMAGLDQPAQNLAFAGSSIFVAFVIFQVDSADWNLTHAAPLAMLYIGIWCVYALMFAMLLKVLRGSQTPITNVLLGVRLFAIFYVLGMIGGSLAFLASGRQRDVFYLGFIAIGFLLNAIYFTARFLSIEWAHETRHDRFRDLHPAAGRRAGNDR